MTAAIVFEGMHFNFAVLGTGSKSTWRNFAIKFVRVVPALILIIANEALIDAFAVFASKTFRVRASSGRLAGPFRLIGTVRTVLNRVANG